MKCFDFKNCYSLLRKKEYSAKKSLLALITRYKQWSIDHTVFENGDQS